MDHALQRLAPLLAGMVDYERLRPDRRLWDLGVVRRLLERPAAPPPARPAVQVAGSKGKGTTCALLDALVTAGGQEAGCYTSPHVDTVLERLRVGGRPIDVAHLEALLRELIAVPGGRAPTFFEAMTVAAATWFADCRVALAIYEAGLGGRLDATTALPVDAAVVTAVELEHTELLGDTVTAIAGEKAPVIRPAGRGFTAASGDALLVVRRHAAAVGARLDVLGEHFGVRDVTWHDGGARGRLWFRDGDDLPFHLPAAAAFELPALALAVAVLRVLLPELPLRLEPAPRPNLPARFEIHTDADGEFLVIDGAHTEQSLAAVGRELERRFPGRRAVVLFACASGKRWQAGLSALLPFADEFVVTGLTGIPGEDPAAIAAWLAGRGARSEVAADAASGLARLRARPGPRLVVGSFYLAGAIRRVIASSAVPESP